MGIVRDALHARNPLGSACHGVQARHNPGRRSANGTNAKPALLAEAARGDCAAGQASMNILQTNKCWFEQGVPFHIICGGAVTSRSCTSQHQSSQLAIPVIAEGSAS